MNLHSLFQKQSFMEEKLCGDHHSIIDFEFLNRNPTINADLYS